MSAKTLYFIFSGTSNYWEDTALFLDLPILKPDNISQKSIAQLNECSVFYYCFDGVSSSSFEDMDTGNPWSIHITPQNMAFDPDKSRFITEKTIAKKSFWVQKAELIQGIGMENNALHALRIYEHLTTSLHQEISKICFLGFSRGGVTAIAAANFISQKVPKSLCSMDMFLFDPVPGPGNFIDAQPSENGLTFSTVTIPENVKRCVLILALEEIMRGFEPLDAKTLKFTTQKTKYIFLPVPDDHSQALMWGAGIAKNFFPNFIEDITRISDKNEIREIRNKLFEFRSKNIGHASNITRHETYLNKKAEFDPNLELLSATPQGFQHIVDTYYKSDYLFEQSRKNFISLQSTIASRAKEQKFLGFGNTRAVRQEHSQYAANQLFLNKHHELCFAIGFPAIYDYLIGIGNPSEDEIKKSINSINKGYVYKFFIQFEANYKNLFGILISGSTLNVTNIFGFSELFNFFYPKLKNSSPFTSLGKPNEKIVANMFMEISSLIFVKIEERKWTNKPVVEHIVSELLSIVEKLNSSKNMSLREKTLILLKNAKEYIDHIDTTSHNINFLSKGNTFLNVITPLSKIAQSYGIADQEWMG